MAEDRLIPVQFRITAMAKHTKALLVDAQTKRSCKRLATINGGRHICRSNSTGEMSLKALPKMGD